MLLIKMVSVNSLRVTKLWQWWLQYTPINSFLVGILKLRKEDEGLLIENEMHTILEHEEEGY